MKYAVFTYDGHGLPVAHHLKNEGKEVIVGVAEDNSSVVSEMEKDSLIETVEERRLRLALFDGIVDKEPAEELIEKLKRVPDPENYFVFFDFNNLFKYADQIRHMGFNGNFPSEEDHLFEIDRDEAKEFVKRYYPKINIQEKKEFKRISEAVAFLQQTEDIWVLKGLDDKAKSVIPDVDDPRLAAGQIIEALSLHPESYEGVGFILEVLVPNIIELTPEKIYYDGEPIAVTLNFENKPLGSGNISVQTGCAADLVFPISFEDRISKIAFPDIVDDMAKQHKGLFIWDASILINKRDGKIFFGEFCSNRPGYNSFFTELSQTSSVSDFFEILVKKRNPFKEGSIGCSNRIFNMNRNPENDQLLGGIKIDYSPEISNDLWLWDAMKKEDKMVSVGYDWNLAVITGWGRSIEEAVTKMYKNIDKFSFVGGYWRPKSDFLSLDYPTSILNRVNYGVERGLYRLPFRVKVGNIA